MCKMTRLAWSVGALFLGATTSGWSQGTCYPPDDSNEAQTFAILSVPLAYSGLGVVTRDKPWRVWAALDVSLVPTIDSATRTPTYCRPGKEAENTNLLGAFPRPRVGLTLPGHFAIEGSWVPPVTIKGVTANLFGLALSWTYPLGTAFRMALRGHATVGEIRAAITCPEEALTDPISECFGGTLSDDRFSPNILGVDATLGWAPGSGHWRPYVGAGYNRLQPRFDVHFVNRVGQLDDTKVVVDLNRAVVFGGLQWLPNAWLQVGGEAYAAPADEITGRIFLKAYLN
jgi:hypothetical protein